MLRPADPLDGATPSGASSITEALLTAAHLVDGDRAQRYLRAAADALSAHSVLLERAPRSAGHWLAVAEAAVRGPLQIAVACDPSRSPLLADARRLAPGGAIVVGGELDSSALLVGRDRVARRRRRLRVPRPALRPAGHPVAELAAALGCPGSSVASHAECRTGSKRSPTRSTATSSWSPRAAPTTWSSLYADDATVEDPVGGEVHIGRQAIHGFYSAVAGRARMRAGVAARGRQRGGVPVPADRDRRRPPDGDRADRRHGLRRPRQGHRDEGLLVGGRRHPAVAG